MSEVGLVHSEHRLFFTGGLLHLLLRLLHQLLGWWRVLLLHLLMRLLHLLHLLEYFKLLHELRIRKEILKVGLLWLQLLPRLVLLLLLLLLLLW